LDGNTKCLPNFRVLKQTKNLEPQQMVLLGAENLIYGVIKFFTSVNIAIPNN
jgi:hypothetical protein